MAGFSRDTFNKLKHYVGVRLQQRVPLVDADWNELEDIRKYELQAFLKWFVGDGVPHGTDGFRIFPVAGRIILSAGKHDIAVNLEDSTAARVLGFDEANCQASRHAPRAAQLIGSVAGPFDGARLADTTLVIGTRNSSQEEWAEERVTFHASEFADRTVDPQQVADAINRVMQHVTATVGAPHDLGITGGSPASPGL